MPEQACANTACSSCPEPDASRCTLNRSEVESRRARRHGQLRASIRGDGAARRARTAIREYGSVICAACHRSFPPSKIQVDHRVPLDDGGADFNSNIWMICEDCHRAEAAQQRQRR